MITVPPNLAAKEAPSGKKAPSKPKKAVKAPKTVGPTKKSTSVAPTKTATKRKAATPENEDTPLSAESKEETQPDRKKSKTEGKYMHPSRERHCSNVLNSTAFDLSDIEDVEPTVNTVTLTAYILVEKNQPSQHPGRKNAKVAENDRFVQRGPFQFKDTDSYASFLVKISQALPCPLLNIVENKITWRPQTPKSTMPLLLGGQPGYDAMITTITSKKPGIVMLTMPPPNKPAEKMVCEHVFLSHALSC